LKELFFLVPAGVVVLGIQTTSWGFLIPPEYKPDLMLILVIWASLRTPFVTGICFSFVAGLLTDLFSGSPTGLFAVIYCFAFIAAGYTNGILSIERYSARAVLVFGACLASGTVVVFTRWLSGPVGFGWHSGGWIVFKSMVTGLAALVALPLIEFLSTGHAKRSRIHG